jgi:hypothetical protein
VVAPYLPTGNQAYDTAVRTAYATLQQQMAQPGLTQVEVNGFHVAYYQAVNAAALNAGFDWVAGEARIAIAMINDIYPSPPLPN